MCQSPCMGTLPLFIRRCLAIGRPTVLPSIPHRPTLVLPQHSPPHLTTAGARRDTTADTPYGMQWDIRITEIY